MFHVEDKYKQSRFRNKLVDMQGVTKEITKPIINDKDNSDSIVLTEKPINISRKVFISSIGGIPVIKEIVVIETEASIARIMGVILSFTIYGLIFQIIISAWNRHHPKSCRIFVTSVLFFFPPLGAFFFGDFFFPTLWLLFMLLMAKTITDCLKKNISSDTPKRTYRIIRNLFRFSYGGSILSYMILFIGFFASKPLLLTIALTLMFTCFYFGLLTREIIEFLSERMAISVGYYSAKGEQPQRVAKDVCIICGDKASENDIKKNKKGNALVSLSCKHVFHVECIKGWLFMGKKGFCPFCKENISVSTIEIDFWEKGENLYTGFLDLMRKAIVFVSMFVAMVMLLRFKTMVTNK